MLKLVLRVTILLLLWILLGIVIFFVNPEIIRDLVISGSYLPFLLLLWITIFYTCLLILGTSKRIVLLAIILSVFVTLLLVY